MNRRESGLDRRAFLTGSGAALAVAATPRAGFAQGRGAARPIVVQLNWMRSVEFAGIWLAHERGYYRAANLDVSLRDWSATIEPTQAVATGMATIGLVSNGLSLATARSNGLPVRAIGTTFQKSAAGLVSKRAKNITKPADLIGKKVGIPQTGRVTWDIFSGANNLKDKVDIHVVGFDLTPLLTDQVDAFLGFSTSQPYTLAAQGVQTNFLYFADFSAPRYDDVIFTNDDQLEKNREAVADWLKATKRGWQDAFTNPNAAVDSVVKGFATNLQAQTPQQRLILKEQEALMASPETRAHGLFWMDDAIWNKGIASMKQLGLLPASFNGEELRTNALLANAR